MGFKLKWNSHSTKNTNPMLDHQKKVLTAIHDNETLFRKELIKSLVWLNAHEQTEFRKWVREQFSHRYQKLINEVLYSKMSVSI
ncbi:MAG: hypothetical protein JXR60_02265 [Bacteroidales bacterium]|nr:hypothetical protein [Bacteroidales bacterium]